jgi:hypothetical protein
VKDWDAGGPVRAVDYKETEKEFVSHIHPLAASDARVGYPWLNYQQCQEINAACERFFRSRNMPYGQYYRQSSQQFYQKHENTHSTQHAPETGPVPKVSPEAGPGGSGGGAGHAD